MNYVDNIVVSIMATHAFKVYCSVHSLIFVTYKSRFLNLLEFLPPSFSSKTISLSNRLERLQQSPSFPTVC